MKRTNSDFSLGEEKPFTTIDINLNTKEIKALELLDMSDFTIVSHYENYGNLDALEDEVTQFILSLGKKNVQIANIIAQLVRRIIDTVLSITGHENSWVTMRAFKPTAMFKDRRWHVDDYYYPPDGEQYKVAITLKGPQTIFYNASSTERMLLDPLKYRSNELRKRIDNNLVTTPKFGQGVIFVVGSPYAPIHSEPNITHERLFMSMIPGTNKQIQALYRQTPEQKIMNELHSNGFYTYFLGPKFGKYNSSPYENTEIVVFKLLPKNFDQLNIIRQLLINKYSESKAEFDTVNQSQMRFTFKNGAVITIHDLSHYIHTRRDNVHTENDLYAILHEYLNTRTLEHSANPNDHVRSVLPVRGKNIVGLFRPTANRGFGEEKIREKMPTQLATNPRQQGLGEHKPFINYNLGLREYELNTLRELKIDAIGHYENYGNLSILRRELVSFIRSLSDYNLNVSSQVANLIFDMVLNVIRYVDCTTAWVTARAFPPVDTFKHPRWHPDRYDYPPPPSANGKQYKAAITLKGPSTVFYDAPLEDRLALSPFKHDRHLLDVVMDKSKLVNAKFGDGTIFITGTEYAPIHSEPHTSEERFFIAIVPGNHPQIERLRFNTPEYKIIRSLCSKGYYCYFIGPQLKSKFAASPYEDTEMLIFKIRRHLGSDMLREHKQSIFDSIGDEIGAKVVLHNPPVIQLEFKAGGCILIRDISSFINAERCAFDSQIDVDFILRKYAALCKQNSPENYNASDSIFRPRFAYNPIQGINTAGLFSPKSGDFIIENMETMLTNGIVSKL